ncbi:hypothetical protein [Paraliomyxa miuraensis]|uniref:hypothetical protein n=1 Tax=Paraliomyxa miuraensis TaxID=376150 RepID=UPI00225A2E92|nr:hypothetical protein [Paraliomyxa miuraensis]MCX4243362.1 hypothetical protein [Paraliomyxa miuraensis]
MKIDKLWMMGLGLLLPLAGCPGDDGPAETGSNDSTSDGSSTSGTTTTGSSSSSSESTAGTVDSTGEPETTGGPMACLGTSDAGAAEGEGCAANSECMSGVCTIFTDVPVNGDAVCAATPPDCATRVTGTVFDFTTREPVGGASVVVAAALQAATNPTGATAIVEGTTNASGEIDVTSSGPISAVVGIVGLTSLGGYYLTATGLAAPVDGGSDYNVANSIHDIWMVPESDLGDWSDALAMDAMIPGENLPLGEQGGVVGLVRDAAGAPIGGAVVRSTNAGSGAFIRYLNDDGSFGDVDTSDLGIFVILAPALAEVFEVEVGGAVAGSGTAGSADGAIFTLIFNVD